MSIPIEKIVGHNKKTSKVKYLVRFKGLTSDEDEWVYERQIENKELIKEYEKGVKEIFNTNKQNIEKHF